MRQSGFAYAAKAAEADTGVPTGWPDGWEFPGTSVPPGWVDLNVLSLWTDSSAIGCGAVDKGNWGVGLSAADPAAWVAAIFASLTGQTVTPTAGTGAGSFYSYTYTDSDPATDHGGYANWQRYFGSIYVPISLTRLVLAFDGSGLYGNTYGDNGVDAQCPNWTLSLYGSLTEPSDPLTSADWDFGDLIDTVTVDMAVGDTASTVFWEVGSSYLTSGAYTYFQIRGDETAPSLLSSVTWPDGVSQTYDRLLHHASSIISAYGFVG